MRAPTFQMAAGFVGFVVALAIATASLHCGPPPDPRAATYGAELQACVAACSKDAGYPCADACTDSVKRHWGRLDGGVQ